MGTGTIYLTVNGQKYDGWQSIDISGGFSQLAMSFSFKAAERFPGSPDKWNIPVGAACDVYWDKQDNDHHLAGGYVDEFKFAYDAKSYDISISGRDITADLIDCAYIETKNVWENQSARSIIDEIIKPFKIPVRASTTAQSALTKPIVKFKTNEGESAFAAISRIAMSRSVIATSYGDGWLTLTQPGDGGDKKDKVGLRSGVNILGNSLSYSNKNRFSKYIVKGQGDTTDFAKSIQSALTPSGSEDDKVITRNRPLVVLLDGKVTADDCKKRAHWERQTRAGKSRRLVVKTDGVTRANGAVWRLNQTVPLKDDMFKTQMNLLITGINYSVSGGGIFTTMTLESPNAYNILAHEITFDGGLDGLVNK